MILIIEPMLNNYWKVVSVGINALDYSLVSGQKIVQTDNWIEGKIKSQVLWDDSLKQVVDLPVALKVAIYKKQKLNEYKEKLIQHIGFIEAGTDKTTLYNQLKNIVSLVKNANTVNDVDTACAQIDQKINSVLSDIGFDASK